MEKKRDYIEERLDLIHSLKRKYGNSIEEILNYKEEIKKELEKIENLEEYNIKLRKRKEELEENLNNLAKNIHEIGTKNSSKLISEINKQLEDLEMKNAKINIKVDYIDNEFFESGKDKVEFYIITNLGRGRKRII